MKVSRKLGSGFQSIFLEDISPDEYLKRNSSWHYRYALEFILPAVVP